MDANERSGYNVHKVKSI